MPSRRSPVLGLNWVRGAIAIALGSALACLFLSPRPAFGLDPNKRVTQYIHTSWRTQDGSLPAGMFSITQSSDGFLWLLSLTGDIYSFDGVSFSPSQVLSGPAGKVFADKTGGVWVVWKQFVRVKDGVVKSQFDLKGIHGFQSISEDADGSLWVGLRTTEAPLCHVTESAAKCFGKNDGVTIPAINAVLADGAGGLWLGGPAGLVHWREHGPSQTYPANVPITSLARTPDGSLWIGISESGTGKGLQQFRDGARKPFSVAGFDGTKISVTSLLVDGSGNLWVGSDANGVFRIHGGTVEHYGHTEGLSGDSTWALFEDREGIVWAGTTSGVDSFRDPDITTFSSVEGLGKDLAAGILASRDGSIWVANNGSLDHIQDGTVSSIRRNSGLPGDQVAAMFEDRAGNMWVGVDDHLYLFKEGRFRRLPEPDHQPLGMVFGLTEDIEGNIWAECGGKPSKLVRIHDFHIREVFPAPQVPPGHNLAPDPHGGLWMVTSKGDLVLLRNGTAETKVSLDPSSSPLNRQILVEADGSILVSSENGLVGWRAGKVQHMTTKNGLPCDFIIAFAEDKQKQWWLYSRCGVVRLSDSELQKWWVNPTAMVQNHLYDALDGAQPNIASFNQASSTSDGRVWFSSGAVVQMVDPSKLSPQGMSATPSIERVIVDRKEVPTTDHLKVPAHPRDLQVDYTSPTFSVPQKVKFRYRLDGYDPDWHDAGTRRQAFYTDLPPGEYSFRVMAANGDGVWNQHAATLALFVTPAYYQTQWFRALCLLLFFGLLWAAYLTRVRRLQHQFDMTLDARVAERTRIARDIHDTLLQSFQALLPRLQAVIYKLPESASESRKTLEEALDQAAQAITEGRDAVQGLRMSTMEQNDLALAIRTACEELASARSSQSPPAFDVVVEGTARELHPILRDEVYRLAVETLRNAFQHAEAHKIEIEIRYDEQFFRLRVRDDGKGIREDVLQEQGRKGHYGLPGIRERAALVGGKLTIWTELESGTEIELIIPAARAYARSTHRFWYFGKPSAKDTDVKETIERE